MAFSWSALSSSIILFFSSFGVSSKLSCFSSELCLFFWDLTVSASSFFSEVVMVLMCFGWFLSSNYDGGRKGGKGKKKMGISNESEKRENDCAHRLVLLEVLFKLPVVLEKLVFLKGTGLVLVFSLKVVYLRRLVKLEHLQSLQMLNFLVLHELLG